MAAAAYAVEGLSRDEKRSAWRDPDPAQLHQMVHEGLAISAVRNFTSFGPYRPAALLSRLKTKALCEPILDVDRLPCWRKRSN